MLATLIYFMPVTLIQYDIAAGEQTVFSKQPIQVRQFAV
jgi:hypothetical protein